MVKVFAWPPVPVLGREWTIEAPVSSSRSLITGRRYVSATQRERRLAQITVSSALRDGWGAGYMEALKRLLDGGVHLVRLKSCRINHARLPLPPNKRQSAPLTWRTGNDPLAWQTDGDPLTWYTGTPLFSTARSSATDTYHWLDLYGLPPNTVFAGPGEFLTLHVGTPEVAETHMIVAPARSNASGEARIHLATRPSGFGRVSIGTQETAVFEAVEMPRSPRMGVMDHTYDWQFREVFADEVDEFVEVDPWS